MFGLPQPMYPKAHAIAAALYAIFRLLYTRLLWLYGVFMHASGPPAACVTMPGNSLIAAASQRYRMFVAEHTNHRRSQQPGLNSFSICACYFHFKEPVQ